MSKRKERFAMNARHAKLKAQERREREKVVEGMIEAVTKGCGSVEECKLIAEYCRWPKNVQFRGYDYELRPIHRYEETVR